MGKALVVDFSGVKDAGEFNPVHKPEGEYKAKITKAVFGQSQQGNDMITFTVHLEGSRTATYPYRCTLTEKSLWKLRNILLAAGLNVPKKKLKIDPDRIVGKTVGIELTDDEYEGKMKSVITGVFDPSEMDSEPATDEDDEDEDIVDEDEDEEEDESPAKKKKAKKKKPVDDEDEDELDLDEI